MTTPSMNNPTTAAHLRQVLDASGPEADARLVEILQAAVRHLHAFVEETGLTHEEWLAGIRFLTAVGQACDERRQEFILLSDTLGVSMLLEMVNRQPAPGATLPTVLGPFHVPGSPRRAFGASIVDDPATGGESLLLHGTVREVDGRPIANATVDIWQVQPDASYAVEAPEAGTNLRGVFETGEDGRYEVRTVRPVDYTVPDDGPVGEMLRAAGRQPWRPAHIHLLVEAPGFRRLVTHVFDSASPWLSDDVVFGVRPPLIVSMDGGDCAFDVVLERA